MDIEFSELTEPTPVIAQSFEKWENDPRLVHLIRPNQDREALETRIIVTVESLQEQLEHHHTYLIHLQDQLIGEMDYQVDPLGICTGRKAGPPGSESSSARRQAVDGELARWPCNTWKVRSGRRD